MKTVVIVRGIDGRTTRVQLLGGNDMVDSERRHGMLTYSFDKRLAPLLRESVVAWRPASSGLRRRWNRPCTSRNRPPSMRRWSTQT